MSRRLYRFALPALPLLLVLCVHSARAQDYYYVPGPVHGYFMGGLSQPVGNTSNLLQSGWTVGGGVEFRQGNNPLSLRLEANYASNNATRQLIDQGSEQTGLQITGGWADTWSGTANVEFRMPFAPHLEAYLIGGVGVYYNRISLTEYGYGYVCNPWWGYCYFASGNAVVAEHDVTKFGWNAGAGVSFALRNGLSLFVEARYNQITMPQTFGYIPVTVGLRF
jgi:opacity protein-like surface antigen